MAGYEITAPDGSVFEVTAPESATEQQILEYAKANMPQASGYGDPTLSERVGGGIMGISQGVSYGFGDELAAGLTAAGASALDALQLDKLLTGKEYDKSFSQTYEDDLTRSRQRMAQAAEQTPLEYYGGQVVGGVATGLGGAATKGGQAVTRMVTQGSLPSRIVSGGLSGAVSGATYGFGTGEGGTQERLESARTGSLYGGVGGAAVPAAGAAIKSAAKGVKNIITGSTARGVEQLDEALGAIRKQASQSYNKMREAGAVIKNKDARVIAQNLDDAMKEAGPSIRELHRPTIAILDSIKKATKKGNIGLDEVDKYRSVLGRIAANKMDGENSYRATMMLRALDDSLESLGENSFIAGNRSALEALKAGRREYSRAKKFELITNIIKKSDGDANYLKRELKKVLDNPKKLRGFNQSEISALKEASKLSFGEGTMKMLGKFGFDLGGSRIGNTALPVIGAGASYAAGSGGLAAIVPTIGTAARYGQKALARGKAENLLKAIEGAAQRQGGTAFRNPAISSAVSRPAANAATPPSIMRRLMRDESGSVGGLDDIDIEALLRETKGMTANKLKQVASDGRKVAQIISKSRPEIIKQAKKQGFDTSRIVYRGLAKPYDSSRAGMKSYQMFTHSGEQAGEYAGGAIGADIAPNVVPAFIRKGKNLSINAANRNFNTLPINDIPDDVLRHIHPSLKNQPVSTDAVSHAAKKAGYDSVTVRNVFDNAWGERTGSPTTIDVIFDPKNIRSVNAAFDPAKAASADLLAQRIPLTAGAGGAVGAAAMGSPEEAQAGIFDDFEQYQRNQNMTPIPEYIPDQSLLQQPQGNLLDRIAMAESSGNPNAKAKTSSASGLFQFTDRTWRNMVKKYGKEAGIKRNDKNNPEAQRVMAELLLQENADILGKKLQREPSDADLYAAHVLGPNYAAKLINAMQQQDPPAIRVVPREFAQANRSIFYDGNRPKRASEVYELLASKVA